MAAAGGQLHQSGDLKSRGQHAFEARFFLSVVFCFAKEAFAGRGVTQHTLAEQLERDVSSEARVFGSIDFAHPADANLAEHLVWPEACVWREKHCLELYCA